MVPMRTVALLVACLLAAPASLAARAAQSDRDGFQQGPPSTTKPGGAPTGSLASIGGKHGPVESSSVSLDALEGAPGKYEGKTLARRVVITSDLRQEGGAFTVGVKDAETGRRLGPGLRDGGVAFVVLPSMAGKLGGELERKPEAVVTFAVSRFPVPGHDYWVAVIARVEILSADGSPAKTIDAR